LQLDGLRRSLIYCQDAITARSSGEGDRAAGHSHRGKAEQLHKEHRLDLRNNRFDITGGPSMGPVHGWSVDRDGNLIGSIGKAVLGRRPLACGLYIAGYEADFFLYGSGDGGAIGCNLQIPFIVQ
jgi:hypothetical protein